MLASSQANSAPTASENGDAAASDVAMDYTAYPPPLRSTEKPITASAAVKLLSPEHVEMYKEVLGYFRNDAYRIPGVRSGKLSEEERFWLVRPAGPFFFFFFFQAEMILDSLKTACCGMGFLIPSFRGSGLKRGHSDHRNKVPSRYEMELWTGGHREA